MSSSGVGSARSVTVEADGGSRGNPGPAGYGAVVLDGDAVLAERWAAIGVDTNNVAEYRGLIAGLEAALELGATAVHVRMDSKLVVEQVQGRWKVRNAGLQPLAARATELLSRFGSTSVEWIPRALNAHADRLANRAMDEAAAGSAAPAWVPDQTAPTRLLLIRHGATEHSPQRRLSGRNDLPLSEQGRAQADALAGRLASWGVEAVVSSPLRRARQTAAVIAERLTLPVTVEPGLVETDFGHWEGLTSAEAAQRDPQLWQRWTQSVEVAAPGGESLAGVARRAGRARDALVAANPGRTVAAVSHVTPIKALLVQALAAPPGSVFRLFLDTASISRVEYAPDGTAVLRLLNDCAHLG